MVNKYFLVDELKLNEKHDSHNYKQIKCDKKIPSEYEKERDGHTCGSPFDTGNILKDVIFHVNKENKLIDIRHIKLVGNTTDEYYYFNEHDFKEPGDYGYAYADIPNPTFYYYNKKINSLFNFIEFLIGHNENITFSESEYDFDIISEFVTYMTDMINYRIKEYYSEIILNANKIFKNFVIKKEKDFYSFQVELVGREIMGESKPFINVIITNLETKETKEITIINYKYKFTTKEHDLNNEDAQHIGKYSTCRTVFSKIEEELNEYIVIPTLRPEHILDPISEPETEVGGRKNITKRSKTKRSKGKRSKTKRSKGKRSKGKRLTLRR